MLNLFDTIRSDLVTSMRALRLRPAITVGAVLSLAIGIGATSTAFGAMYGLMLRPLPYGQADELVSVRLLLEGEGTIERQEWPFPYFRAMDDVSREFSSLSSYFPTAFNFGGVATPERVAGEYVSANYLETLRISPFLGRDFVPAEDVVGSSPVGLISHRLWTNLGAPGLGTLPARLDGVSVDVVGVLPPNFKGISGVADILVPMAQVDRFDSPGRLDRMFNYWHRVVGRVATGVSSEALEARLATTALAMREMVDVQPAGLGSQFGLRARPLVELRAGQTTRSRVWILMSAAVLVLMVGCANLANLLLARGVDRRREMAVRSALGASTARLVRLTMTEATVLGLVGAAVGLVVAWIGLRGLTWMASPMGDPLAGGWQALGQVRLELDNTVIAFAVVTAVIGAMASSIIPASRVARHLRGNLVERREIGLSGGPSRPTVGAVLITLQMAVAVTLLVGGGLLIRSLSGLLAVETGFDHEHILTLEARLPAAGYSDEDLREGIDRILAGVRSVPGVTSASVDYAGPYSGTGSSRGFLLAGEPDPVPGERPPSVRIHVVAPGHFEVLDIPVIRGRDFVETDTETGAKRVILGRAAADRYFPEGDALGQSVWVGVWERSEIAEVVGIVEDPRYSGREATDQPHAYVLYSQVEGERRMTVLAHTAGPPAAMAGPVRRAIARVDANLPFTRVLTMEERMAWSAGTERLLTVLLTWFAGSALLLAAVGVYGVVSFAVGRSTRELGIRSALGAQPRQLTLQMMLGFTAWCALGAALGVAAAIPLSEALRGALFGIGPHDPLTLGTAPLILIGVGVLSSWIPARRCARADPALVMRDL